MGLTLQKSHKFAQWSVVLTLSLRNVRWSLVALALLIQFSEGHSLVLIASKYNGFLWDAHAQFCIRKPVIPKPAVSPNAK